MVERRKNEAKSALHSITHKRTSKKYETSTKECMQHNNNDARKKDDDKTKTKLGAATTAKVNKIRRNKRGVEWSRRRRIIAQQQQQFVPW